jgi:hypothetical protein
MYLDRHDSWPESLTDIANPADYSQLRFTGASPSRNSKDWQYREEGFTPSVADSLMVISPFPMKHGGDEFYLALDAQLQVRHLAPVPLVTALLSQEMNPRANE